MQYLKFIPYVLNLMIMAEKLFTGQAKSGAAKKEIVMTTAQTVLSAAEELSTGGQKQTWTQIAPHVSQIVDSAASIMFKPSNGAAPAPEPEVSHKTDERG